MTILTVITFAVGFIVTVIGVLYYLATHMWSDEDRANDPDGDGQEG